jgi:putative membrane protein
MVLGIVIGALCFSRIVTYLLTRFPQATLAALIGFMIGALRSVWPFWTYRYQLAPLRLQEGPVLEAVAPAIPDTFSTEVLIACCIGCAGIAAVFVLEKVAYKKEIT